jgi:hypothetical protein
VISVATSIGFVVIGGVLGFLLCVVVNRSRWAVFPMSGGGLLLSWMGGPPVDRHAIDHDGRVIGERLLDREPIDIPCEHCGAPPGTTCVHDNTDPVALSSRYAMICSSCGAEYVAREPAEMPLCTRCSEHLRVD